MTYNPSSGGSTTVHTENGFRLTLTSGSPAPSASGVTSTTVYCTPYRSNAIWTYDSSVWTRHTSSEFSLGLGTLTSGKCYDVFVYNNSGTLTLELSSAWSSDTARNDAIAQQDGVWVKSSDHSRRLLGTFYTTSTTQTKDTPGFRYLDNVDNRIPVRDTTIETAGNWAISTTSWSAMNSGGAAWVHNYVSSLGEDSVFSLAGVLVSNGGVGTGYLSTAIDSTSTKATGARGVFFTGGGIVPATTTYTGNPGIGKHSIQVLNGSDSASGTRTFYSNPGPGALDTEPSGLTSHLLR